MRFDVVISTVLEASSKEDALTLLDSKIVKGYIYRGDRNRANPDVDPLVFSVRLDEPELE